MIRRHFLTYLALSTMAVSQPLLDLYGKNPTVFSAAKLSQAEAMFFVLGVAFGPALIAVLLDRLSRFLGPKVNEAFRLWLIAGFSFLLGLAVARWVKIDSNVGALSLGLVTAVLVPVAFDKYKPVREWSRWLSVLSVAVLGSAVLQLQPILVPTDGPRSDAVIGKPDITVLQVVFDEFPLAPLLGPDGSINSERFPGIAELAESSTWYRNSSAESNFTHQAVPAILASAVPGSAGGPFLAQYPKNIFTLFAGKTTVAGIEPVTSLCPHSVCRTTGTSPWSFEVGHILRFVRDASYVYGQRVMPPVIRKHVPSIDGAWGGFGAVANRFKEQFDVGALSQPDAIARGVANVVNDPSPRVQVVHALLPHAPWRLLPDGRVAPLSAAISTRNPKSFDGVRDEYQTFLLQAGAADSAIKSLIAELKQAGRWDTTLLVVTADHGISFIPGRAQRHTRFDNPDQVADIYRIPTFIKYPGQKSGVVSDCAISNLDLLPTIIDVTDTRTTWKFGGESIASACPQGRVRRVVSATGGESVITGSFQTARARAAHYATVVPNIGSSRRISAVGASASLIGSPLRSDDQTADWASWTVTQKRMFKDVSTERGARVPSLITGTVTLAAEPLPKGAEGIVTIDGVAAGVIGELSGAKNSVSYTAILDHGLLTKGAHDVELFIRMPDGEIVRVGAPR